MPPSFPRQNQAVVLRDPDPCLGALRLRGYHPLRRGIPAHFGFGPRGAVGPYNPTSPVGFPTGFGLGSPPFGRPYSGDPCWFLFLPLLRCFRWGGSHSVLPYAGFPSVAGYSPATGGPIRRSRDQRLHAPTPGLSQLATSFVGARAEPSTGRLGCANLGRGPVSTAGRTVRGAHRSPPIVGRLALHPRGITSRAASGIKLKVVPGGSVKLRGNIKRR